MVHEIIIQFCPIITPTMIFFCVLWLGGRVKFGLFSPTRLWIMKSIGYNLQIQKETKKFVEAISNSQEIPSKRGD